MHVHGSPRVHTRIHTPYAGTQHEPLSLHTHGDTHQWSRAFMPALQHFPTHHTHSQAGPAGRTHTHTHTHTSARSTQQAQNQPAQPSVRFPPPGRHKLAAAESAPGCRQGHRQGKGEGGGQLVGLEGQRSQQPPPSSPVAGAQTPASESIHRVSLPPRSSFQRGFLHLDSLSPSPHARLLPASPGHHFVVHFHYAVGVTAPRPAEGEGLGSRLERVDWSGDPSPSLFYRWGQLTQRAEGICSGSHNKFNRGRTSGDHQTMPWLPSSYPLHA